MSDSLPNIYYSSESNKFINLANKELSSSSKSNLESQKSSTINNYENKSQSIDCFQKIETKENPIQYKEDIPTEISGTILSISDFSISNENIVIGGIKIKIKNDNDEIYEIQVNPKDLIENIAEKYRKMAKINNNHRIFLMKEDGDGLHRKMSLDAQGVKDGDIIVVKQLDNETRKKLAEKIKKGLPFFIIDSEFGNEAFYGKGNVMFRTFADKFREKHPGKKFIFRYRGMVIKDEKKTIEQLGFEQSERVYANLVDENNS